MGIGHDARRVHRYVAIWRRYIETFGTAEGCAKMIWRGITLISCGIVGGWLGFMASDREPPVKHRANEIINSPKPGEVLRIRHLVWRDRSCKTTVNRLVFDKDNDRFIVPDLEFSEGVLPLGADTFVAPIDRKS